MNVPSLVSWGQSSRVVLILGLAWSSNHIFQFDETKKAAKESFFSIFYMAINCGALLAMFITPYLRTQNCFGADTCFPLAFGVPGILMLVAFILFLAGWKFYKIDKPSGENILCQVADCIRIGVIGKIKAACGGEKKDHWLDYGTRKYSNERIYEVKCYAAVAILFLPVTLFWTLFDQQVG